VRARVSAAAINHLIDLCSAKNDGHSCDGARGLYQTIFMVQSGQNRRRLDATPVRKMMSGRLRPV
jgi:hypothetical protein